MQTVNQSQINLAILVEAKNEYNKTLVLKFRDYMVKLFNRLYTEAELFCVQENTPENILMLFQNNLSKIGKWSSQKLNSEYEVLKKITGCNWMDDLIKAIFITHTKIMTMSCNIKQNAKLNIKLPETAKFLHLCLLEVARQIWRSPYLFVKHINALDYQKNMRDVDKIINDAICDVLQNQLPLQSILQEYLNVDITNMNTNTNTNMTMNTNTNTNMTMNTLLQDNIEHIAKAEVNGNKYKTKIDKLLDAEPVVPVHNELLEKLNAIKKQRVSNNTGSTYIDKLIAKRNKETSGMILDGSIQDNPVPVVHQPAEAVPQPAEEVVPQPAEAVQPPEEAVQPMKEAVPQSPEEAVPQQSPEEAVPQSPEEAVPQSPEEAVQPPEEAVQPVEDTVPQQVEEVVSVQETIVKPVEEVVPQIPDNTGLEDVLLTADEFNNLQFIPSVPELSNKLNTSTDITNTSTFNNISFDANKKLLGASELDDIDLEENSIEEMTQQILAPIKINNIKPHKFEFFKHAPKYPG